MVVSAIILGSEGRGWLIAGEDPAGLVGRYDVTIGAVEAYLE